MLKTTKRTFPNQLELRSQEEFTVDIVLKYQIAAFRHINIRKVYW